MSVRFDIRKSMLTLAIIVAIIAVAFPVCQMVSCGMSGSATGGMSGFGSSLSDKCDLPMMGSTAPAGVVPPSAEALILALGLLVLALAGAVLPSSKSRLLVPVAVFADSSPPDPLGVRLRL
jgi:hypothetical protein